MSVISLWPLSSYQWVWLAETLNILQLLASTSWLQHITVLVFISSCRKWTVWTSCPQRLLPSLKLSLFIVRWFLRSLLALIFFGHKQEKSWTLLLGSEAQGILMSHIMGDGDANWYNLLESHLATLYSINTGNVCALWLRNSNSHRHFSRQAYLGDSSSSQ